jgi:hypothetical protein
MEATSVAEEGGTTGLIGVARSQAHVLHSPVFWALAIVAFGGGILRVSGRLRDQLSGRETPNDFCGMLVVGEKSPLRSKPLNERNGL